MDWQAALRENWPYKLAAFALALLLWFNVTSDEQQPQAVPTQLRITVQDSGWVLTEAPDQVSTTFQGRRGDLLGFSFDPPVLRRVVEQVTDTVMQLDLSPQDVAVDPEVQARAVSIRPSSVEIRLERVVSRKIPVEADVRAAPASGFTLSGGPQVRPDSVTVRGARSEVRSLSEIATEPVSLDALSETVTREVALQLPRDLQTLQVDSAQVLLTVQVDSLVERRLTVPVSLRGAGAAGLRADPPAVAVTLRGPRAVVRELRAEDIAAEVEVRDGSPAGSEDRRLPVQVRLPAGIAATATPTPPVVAVGPAEDP